MTDRIQFQSLEARNPVAERRAEREAQITVERGATGETRRFDTEAEAHRFCRHRGDYNELWRIECP